MIMGIIGGFLAGVVFGMFAACIIVVCARKDDYK